MSESGADRLSSTAVPPTLRLLPHMLVMSTGYVLFAIAALPDVLMGQLGINPSAFGLLTSAPLGAFVLVQPLASRLSDRYSTAQLLLWATAIHLALAIALDITTDYLILLGLRFVWGLVAGFVVSVGATHVARLRQGGAATLEQGIFGGMMTLGGTLAFLFAGPMVAATGGLGLHALGVVPGAVALVIGLRHHEDRLTVSQTAPSDFSANSSQPHGQLGCLSGSASKALKYTLTTVTDPTVLSAGFSYIAIIGSYVTLSTFITSYFGELGVLGPLNALVLLGATVGRVSGGLAVWRFPVSDTVTILLSIATAAAGFFALATGLHGQLLVVFPFATMVALSVPFGAVFDLAAEATDTEGRALATVVAAGNLAALVLPPIAGALRTATGGYGSVFAMLALLNVGAMVGTFALRRIGHSQEVTLNA